RVGIFLLLADRVEALAHAAIGVTLAAQDLVDLGADLGNLRETHLVNFGRREVRGGRLAQRLGVDGLAVGQPPRAVTGAAGRLQRFHRRDLAVQRGVDRLGHYV